MKRSLLEAGIALTLVATLVAAAHWPVLRAQALSLDDENFVTHNPLTTNPSWNSFGRFFTEVLHPSTVKGYYLPLSMTSLMLDYSAGGRPENLRAFHRTSLALHILCTLLLTILVYRLFGDLVLAASAGLLFGLHPLTVEPVAWAGERKTVLATFFAFASLLAYVESVRRHSRGGFAAALGFFLLALLSKPTVIPLPLLLLVLDWWPLARLRRATVLEKWPFFLLSLAFAIITFISHRSTAGVAATSQSSLLHWPLKACYLLVFYLGKIAWPQNLSCIYPTPTRWTLGEFRVTSCLIVVATTTAAFAWLVRRTRAPLAGWIYFVLALAPTLGLVKYSWVIASDKYVYFAAPGILLPLVAGLAALGDKPVLRRAALGLVAVACSCEAWGTRVALRHWKDSLTLFRHMEARAPDSPVVHNELGLLLDEPGQHGEALRHLEHAVEIAPTYADAQYNLGILLENAHRSGEAVQHLRVADELRPDSHTAFHLGAAARQQGDLSEAEAQLRRALRLQPDNLEAADVLGGVLMDRRRFAEAVAEFRSALIRAPDDPALQFHLGVALLGAGGHSAEAVELLRRVVHARPDEPEPQNALAWTLATDPDAAIRRPNEALSLATHVVKVTGRSPRALDTQAAAQAAAGQFVDAVSTAQAALELAAAAHDDSLAAEIRRHLSVFSRRSAFVDMRAPSTASR